MLNFHLDFWKNPDICLKFFILLQVYGYTPLFNSESFAEDFHGLDNNECESRAQAGKKGDTPLSVVLKVLILFMVLVGLANLYKKVSFRSLRAD